MTMSATALSNTVIADCASLDEVDRRLILLTQAGLPLVAQPYTALATQLALEETEVLLRLQRMLDTGIIRRIGAVPNHYKLGYRSNGMSVWDVADAQVIQLGEAIGKLTFVSHCYQRPRHLPVWPYNLFAMVHAASREQALDYVEQIRQLLGNACRRHDVLFSTQILKKTGVRLTP